jgi:lipopolysaccharide biosynthesis glycosyltransferase
LKSVFTANYSVITFATAKSDYLQLAFNCARSILLFNDIKIYIVTNLTHKIPAQLHDHIFFIPPKPEHITMGTGMKLYIDEYVQTEHTLFIDSDCLCFDSLEKIFSACTNMDISCAGTTVPAASWCGETQAKTIKENFGLDNLIRFNGALYYIKKSHIAHNIFDKARSIAHDYDKYGFSRINNKWINEEGPISIAMMLNQQLHMPDNGEYMTDLYTDRQPALNVLKGLRLLKNPSYGMPLHREWYPSHNYSPVILHFGGSNLNTYPYIAQRWLLKLYNAGFPISLATGITNIFIDIPYHVLHWLNGSLKKSRIRP